MIRNDNMKVWDSVEFNVVFSWLTYILLILISLNGKCYFKGADLLFWNRIEFVYNWCIYWGWGWLHKKSLGVQEP